MACLQSLFVLATILFLAPDEAPKVVEVVRNAYEENVVALAAFGTIHFHATDGELKGTPNVGQIRELIKSDWIRRSQSHGSFFFDGRDRRFEDLYPAETLVARRERLSDSSWSSPISSIRLLLDGETTLVDRVNVAGDGKTFVHTPGCYKGDEWSIARERIPFHLTDLQPPRTTLGGCLRDYVDGVSGVALLDIDESARVGEVSTVRLAFEMPNPRTQATFWVDLEHGAVPIQTRMIEIARDGQKITVWQENLSDLRWAARGWLPFHTTHVTGQASKTATSSDPFSGGPFSSFDIKEIVVDEAKLDRRPDPSVFVMEFPNEIGVVDQNRLLSYGRRRIWTLHDFSPAARTSAQRIIIKSPFATLHPPDMPGPQNSRTWWPPVLAFLGLVFLVAAGFLFFRKRGHHAI